MVAVSVHACGSQHAGIGGGEYDPQVAGFVADACHYHDIGGDGPFDRVPKQRILAATAGDTDDLRPVLHRPVDPGGKVCGSYSRVGAHREDLGPGRDPQDPGCTAAVRGDEPCDSGAVPGLVAVTVAAIEQVRPWQHVANQIRMARVDAGVQHPHDDAVTLAGPLCVGDVQVRQVPLRVALLIGVCRHGRQQHHRSQQRHGQRQPAPPHRSIPITPGPGSWRSGSGAGSITGGTPTATAHGLSGSKPCSPARRSWRSCRERRGPMVTMWPDFVVKLSPPRPPTTPPIGLTRRPTAGPVRGMAAFGRPAAPPMGAIGISPGRTGAPCGNGSPGIPGLPGRPSAGRLPRPRKALPGTVDRPGTGSPGTGNLPGSARRAGTVGPTKRPGATGPLGIPGPPGMPGNTGNTVGPGLGASTRPTGGSTGKDPVGGGRVAVGGPPARTGPGGVGGGGGISRARDEPPVPPEALPPVLLPPSGDHGVLLSMLPWSSYCSGTCIWPVYWNAS